MEKSQSESDGSIWWKSVSILHSSINFIEFSATFKEKEKE